MKCKSFTVLFYLLMHLFSRAGIGNDLQAFGAELAAGNTNEASVVNFDELYKSSFALVIGNDTYSHGWPRLSTKVKDAGVIADELRNRGFDVTFKTNLDAKELEQTFFNFFLSKGKDRNSRLFVWFGGHGYTKNDEGFLIATDTPRPDNDTEFHLKALPVRDFEKYMRMASSKHVFVIFDSCFSDTRFSAQPFTSSQRVTLSTAFPARQFVSSGRAGQVLADDSVFQNTILKALHGDDKADLNKDGFLTASEIGNALSGLATGLTGTNQVPQYGRLLGPDYSQGDFVFLVYDEKPSRDKPWLEILTGMKFIWVEGGCFEMGQTEEEKQQIMNDVMGRLQYQKLFAWELPRHRVCVNGFWMGKYEVTNYQYGKYDPKHSELLYHGISFNENNLPAIGISWNQAVNYAKWLSKKYGRTFRLPTEAEWEYAARSGGQQQRYAGGDCEPFLAWYKNNSAGSTHTVGTKTPNGLGIYDMSGNVWEWCSDWADSNYYSYSPIDNPQGPSSGCFRVMRGGGWDSDQNSIRTATRFQRKPDFSFWDIGFRLVMAPDP